jgi:hypothetical protein
MFSHAINIYEKKHTMNSNKSYGLFKLFQAYQQHRSTSTTVLNGFHRDNKFHLFTQNEYQLSHCNRCMQQAMFAINVFGQSNTEVCISLSKSNPHPSVNG